MHRCICAVIMLSAVFLLSVLTILQVGAANAASTNTPNLTLKHFHEHLADNVNVALLRGLLDDIITENNKRQSAAVATSEEQLASCVTSDELLEIVEKVQSKIVTAINTTIVSEVLALEERRMRQENNVSPPSTPSNLLATSTPNASIYITWAQLPDDRVDYYTLSVEYIGPCQLTETPRSITFGGGTREYRLTDLRRNSVYGIELQAVNTGGRSQIASVDSITSKSLPTSAPNTPPQSVTSLTTTPTSVTIEWSQSVESCLNENGVMSSYDVRVNGGIALTTSQRRATITGLTSNTLYSIGVRERNYIGVGPFSGNIAVSTPSRKGGDNRNVKCYTDVGCSDSGSLPVMTVEECCVHTPTGLSYSDEDGDKCNVCIVIGWLQKSLIAPEQGPDYVVQVGFLKGSGMGQKLDFHLNINTELGSATPSDFTLHPPSFTIPSNKPLTEDIGITFHLDAVAQEENETAILTLVPLHGDLEDHFDPSVQEGVFFEDQLLLKIIDRDYVTFSLTNDDYRATEADLTMPVRVMRHGFIGSPVAILITPITLSEHRATGRPHTHRVPYNDPLSPTEADKNDFDSSGIVVVFEASEDSSLVIDLPVPVPINNDDINEAPEQVFIVAMTIIDAVDISRVNLTQQESVCRIIDDDPIRIGFEQSQYVFQEPEYEETIFDEVFLVKENNTKTEQTFLVVVTATGHTPLNSNISPASVSSRGSDGYVLDNDYSLGRPDQRSIVLNFHAQSQKISINFRLYGDNEVEGTEAFQVSVLPHETNAPLFFEPLTFYSSTFIVIEDQD